MSLRGVNHTAWRKHVAPWLSHMRNTCCSACTCSLGELCYGSLGQGPGKVGGHAGPIRQVRAVAAVKRATVSTGIGTQPCPCTL
jgi:hypothetical protein